jgi:predicted RND superfamily exporter protein
MFVMNGGGHAYPVYLYGRGKLSNGKDAMRFQDEAGSIRVGGKTYTATGGALMYASVLRAVIRQGPLILAASLAMILLVVLAQMRSLKKGFLALLPLLLGSCVMVLVMTASGIRLNIYNVAILSAVAGLGIDYGVHLVVHTMNLPASLPAPERASTAVRELFGPILFSWLTTSAGYVGLLISHHAGLRSIGLVALVGLGSCFVMAVTLLPMILAGRPASHGGFEPGSDTY